MGGRRGPLAPSPVQCTLLQTDINEEIIPAAEWIAFKMQTLSTYSPCRATIPNQVPFGEMEIQFHDEKPGAVSKRISQQ
jgi:hypothetical protein